MVIMDKNKKAIKTFATDSKDNKMDISKGMNQFVWDMRYPEADKIDGMILWTGVPGSITAPPGEYFYKLKVGKDSVESNFMIKADPNYKCSQQDYEAQFAFLQMVTDKFNEIQKGIKNIRSLRTQINDFTGKQEKDAVKEVKQMADSINKQLTAIEETLYQTKSKSGQDPLNFPIRLNDKLSGLFDAANSGNFAPGKQSKEVYADLSKQCDEQLNKLKKVMDTDVVKFNQLIREKALPVIGLKKE
jgi:methyl-accepting chemotaxis protein